MVILWLISTSFHDKSIARCRLKSVEFGTYNLIKSKTQGKRSQSLVCFLIRFKWLKPVSHSAVLRGKIIKKGKSIFKFVNEETEIEVVLANKRYQADVWGIFSLFFAHSLKLLNSSIMASLSMIMLAGKSSTILANFSFAFSLSVALRLAILHGSKISKLPNSSWLCLVISILALIPLAVSSSCLMKAT